MSSQSQLHQLQKQQSQPHQQQSTEIQQQHKQQTSVSSSSSGNASNGSSGEGTPAQRATASHVATALSSQARSTHSTLAWVQQHQGSLIIAGGVAAAAAAVVSLTCWVLRRGKGSSQSTSAVGPDGKPLAGRTQHPKPASTGACRPARWSCTAALLPSIKQIGPNDARTKTTQSNFNRPKEGPCALLMTNHSVLRGHITVDCHDVIKNISPALPCLYVSLPSCLPTGPCANVKPTANCVPLADGSACVIRRTIPADNSCKCRATDSNVAAQGHAHLPSIDANGRAFDSAHQCNVVLCILQASSMLSVIA
jgi:hypothetical protein